VAVDVVEILDVLGDIAAKWTVDAAYSGANPVWKSWIESLGAALRGVGAEWTARVEWARDLGDHLGVADDRSLAAIADEVEATSTVLDQVVGQQDDPNVLLALREMRRLSDADVRAMIAEFDSAAAPSWPEQFRRVAGLDEQLAEKTTIAVRMINSYLEDAESAVDEKQESGGSASALEKARAVLVESIDSFDAALEAIDG
jgi:hypothetical protein